jgi:hypothetical protein
MSAIGAILVITLSAVALLGLLGPSSMIANASNVSPIRHGAMSKANSNA